MIRALIIDDEPPACDILRALLADHPHVSVIGEAGTLASARARLAADDYDLVFLDVQLRGGSGFDLVPLVRPGARIIFVTAYDQHALRAFEVNALDYLLKPVAPDRLATALSRLPPPFRSGERQQADLPHLAPPPPQPPNPRRSNSTTACCSNSAPATNASSASPTSASSHRAKTTARSRWIGANTSSSAKP